MRLKPHQFLNYVYAWCVERLPADRREAWEHELIAPIPGQETRVSPEVAEEEGAAFMQMMQINQNMTGA